MSRSCWLMVPVAHQHHFKRKLTCDTEVTGQCHLQASAEGVAVDCRDGRHREPLV